MFSFLQQTLLKPDAEALKPHLYPPVKSEPLSFSRLPKGIDNIHYDVAISPDFRRTVTTLTRLWLKNALYSESGKTQKKTEASQLDSLRENYFHLSENAVHMARQQRSIQVLQLFQMGITKFLLQTTLEEARNFRQEVQDKVSSKKGGVEQHDKLVTLAREEPIYLYSIRRKLFSHIHKLEQTRLRRVRHSMLGSYWPVPQRLILNPLLVIPSLSLDQAVMDYYHLMLTDKEEINCFDKLNRHVTALFSEYLPSEVMAPPLKKGNSGDMEQDSRFDIRNRLDQGTLRGFLEAELFLREMLQEDEYQSSTDTWLDEPSNMQILFPPDESFESQVARTRQTTIKWRNYLTWLSSDIRQKLKSDHLLDRVSAHHPSIQLYRQYRGKISVRMIYQYLAGMKDRKQLQRYLISHPAGTHADNVIRDLTAARKAVHKRSKSERQQDISECLLAYARLRSDIKNAYRSYAVMDQIRVLSEDSDIELSKANNSLHSFYNKKEDKEEVNTDIINHVIIKADLRGSTRITETLVKQGLNPATHFSLNFFDPINKLYDAFGAEKVFVEGDAAIVSIFEYGDKNTEWLAVARSCCLARKMIEVMDSQNSKNKSNGLPELEMGIGLAFADGSPAFLYDGDHRIMISPAINRSSQLSNCSAMLRTKSMLKTVGPRGLRVLTAKEEDMEKVADDKLLRYNVNGIELDTPAFLKLQKELSLLKGGDKEARYYMGRVPDKNGAIHTLVVRERPVRLWDNEKMGAEDARGRRYFEVVTEADKIQTATRLLEDSSTSNQK